MDKHEKTWVRTSFPLRKDQAETLYHLAYTLRTSQANILRTALDQYFVTMQEKEVKTNAQT